MKPLLKILLPLAMVASSAHATLIFSENFNSYTPSNCVGCTGSQFQTGLALGAIGTIPGWTSSGTNAVHAVTLAPGNIALQIYSGSNAGSANQVTLATGIAANTLGIQYQVSFDVAPTVWNASGEATNALNSVLVQILRADNSILQSYSVSPGAWAGTQNPFSPTSFSYTGDGSGNTRIKVASGASNSRFSGAVDNLSVSVVPVPAAVWLFGSALGALGVARRRQRQSATV